MLRGLPLFPGDTMAERYAAVARYDDDAGALAMEKVPSLVREVLTRALRASPDDRYQNAGEMEEDLSRCLDMVSTAPTRQALGSLVREYFGDEYRQDRADATAPSADEVPPTVVRGIAPPPGLEEEQEATIVSPPSRARSFGRRIAMAALFVGFTGVLTVAIVWAVGLMPGGATPTPTILAASSPTPLATQLVLRTEVVTVTATVTATRVVTATVAATATRTARTTPKPAPTRAKIVRRVPTYAVSFLDGCTDAQLDTARKRIKGAIRQGFSLYNEGKVAECFAIYAAAARKIQTTLPAACPGPRKAMGTGLARANKQGTPRQKAWAMRDAFDGLLNVIRKRKPS